MMMKRDDDDDDDDDEKREQTESPHWLQPHPLLQGNCSHNTPMQKNTLDPLSTVDFKLTCYKKTTTAHTQDP